MSQIVPTIHQIVRQYRRSLLLRDAVKLCLLSVFAVLFIVHPMNDRIPSLWGIGGVVVVLFLGGFVLFRRHTRLRTASTASLDTAAQLKERLVTVEAFAQIQPQPRLYPYLLKDIEDQLSVLKAKIPAVWDVFNRVLAVALLILLALFWRQGVLSHMGHSVATVLSEESIQQARFNHPFSGKRGTGQDTQTPKPDPLPDGASQPKSHAVEDAPNPVLNPEDHTPLPEDLEEKTNDNPAHPDGDPKKGTAKNTSQKTEDEKKGQELADGQQDRPSGPSQEDAELRSEIKELLEDLSEQMKDMQMQLQKAEVDSKETSDMTDPNLYGEKQNLGSLEEQDFSIEFDADAADVNERLTQGTGDADKILSHSSESKTLDVDLTQQTQRDLGNWKVTLPPDYQQVVDEMKRKQP